MMNSSRNNIYVIPHCCRPLELSSPSIIPLSKNNKSDLFIYVKCVKYMNYADACLYLYIAKYTIYVYIYMNCSMYVYVCVRGYESMCA